MLLTSHRLVIEVVDIQRPKINVKKDGNQRQAILSRVYAAARPKGARKSYSRTWDMSWNGPGKHRSTGVNYPKLFGFEFVVYSF
jgi:hypothetical protein